MSVPAEAHSDFEFRVLVRGATARDNEMAVRELNRSGIQAEKCASVEALRREAARGCGAVLIAEEVLLERDGAQFLHELSVHEPWSDLWLLVLARQGADSRVIAEAMATGANLAVLERPMRVTTLISSVRTALRARRR